MRGDGQGRHETGEIPLGLEAITRIRCVARPECLAVTHSAVIGAPTTCSNFFTIYAYAQAGKEINGTFVPDSEHLTKTLLEVEITTPATTTTSAVYKVKSLYTQSIPMGE